MKTLTAKSIVIALGLTYSLVGGFVQAAGNLPLSQSSVYVNVGQNTTVTVSPPFGQAVNISAISNTYVAYANISNNVVTIYGLANGTSQIELNTYDNYSAIIYVTVGAGTNPNPPNNPLSFSQNNVSLNTGQNLTVNIYSNVYNDTFYISGNSNSSSVSAYVSGNSLNLYGNNPGSSVITVNSSLNPGNSGTLFVTVSGYNYPSGLYFTSTTSPPEAVLGQFYSFSMQVTGGTSPYYFNLNGGTLPSGLSVSATGVISGVPTAAGNYNFTIRAYDYYNRNVISPTLRISVGVVSGISIYANGTLLKDNGTIYLVYKNTKSGFSNFSAFQGLGYKLSNVTSGSSSGLVNSGFVISSAQMAHPWGSWIIRGSTIYFVHAQGLIPVSSYETFLNNGGIDKILVPANAYDFYKPVLDLLTLDDWRLK